MKSRISWEQDKWGDYISVLGYEILRFKEIWVPYLDNVCLCFDDCTLEQAMQICEDDFNAQ